MSHTSSEWALGANCNNRLQQPELSYWFIFCFVTSTQQPELSCCACQANCVPGWQSPGIWLEEGRQTLLHCCCLWLKPVDGQCFSDVQLLRWSCGPYYNQWLEAGVYISSVQKMFYYYHYSKWQLSCLLSLLNFHSKIHRFDAYYVILIKAVILLFMHLFCLSTRKKNVITFVYL